MPDYRLSRSDQARLTGYLLRQFALRASSTRRERARRVLRQHMEEAVSALSAGEQNALLSLLAGRRSRPFQEVQSTSVWKQWLDALARSAVSAWTRDRAGPDPGRGAVDLGRLEPWLAARDRSYLHGLLGAAVRLALDRTRSTDAAALESSFQRFSLETAMPTTPNFYIDTSIIPPLKGEAERKLYLEAIQKQLVDSFGMSRDEANVAKSPKAAAIVGMILLDEEYDPSSLSFFESLKRAWSESLGKTKSNSSQVPNQAVYAFVVEKIIEFNDSPKISYQELAAVSRYAIGNSETIPFDHPNFIASVRIGLDQYVAGTPSGDSLTLPTGSLPGTADDVDQEAELNGPNISVFGTVYAISLLDRGTKIFNVIDRITELFTNGMLPIGYDTAGKAIDAYYWNSEDRLPESGRMSHYTRIVGSPGGQVSREVLPNKDFEQIFMRFISSVAEYDRQRRVADILDTRRRSLALTGEQVRKAGRDLAANASLYGYSSCHFVARRLNTHLTAAMTILKLPQVQKAFGVTSPWQVVERVAISEFNVTPNIIKFRTMAEASKAIFDLLARKTRELALSNSPRPFLYETTLVVNGETSLVGNGDLSEAETAELLRSVQHLLAVNGVADDQVLQYSKPTESVNAPSLPSFGGGKADGDVVEKLRGMIASGSTPSLDQLQQMLPGMH